MVTLEALTRRIKEAPPLPEIVVRLLQASRDPNSDLREMVELIRLEPALTTKVLRLCNSSFYGLPRRIKSIKEALIYLGTDTLINFILAGCLSTYYQQAQEGYGLSEGELWRHSVACGLAARRLAAGSSDDEAAEAFTAGLLHDIGKIALNPYVAAEQGRIAKLVRERGVSFEAAEREVLGFSHTDAGAQMARAWNLPDSLVAAIAHHQDPSRAEGHHELVARVHLANILAVSFGYGLGSDGLATTFDPMALRLVGLEVGDLYSLSIEIHEQFHQAEELVGLTAAR
jgi:putative nucleotidyltransferase with HDIG domain